MAVRRNLVTCRHLEAEQERAFLSGIAVKQRSLCSRRQGSRACTPGDFVGRCDVVRAAGRALRRRGAGGKGERTRRDRENKLFHFGPPACGHEPEASYAIPARNPRAVAW